MFISINTYALNLTQEDIIFCNLVLPLVDRGFLIITP